MSKGIKEEKSYAYPIVSCLGEMGMTPLRLVSPIVGLIPTTELAADGQSIEPSVSVPRVTVTRLAAAAMADPLLDPHGSADSMYGFCTQDKITKQLMGQCKMWLTSPRLMWIYKLIFQITVDKLGYL
jgi:hypothetical protein